MDEREKMCVEVAHDTSKCIWFIDGSHIPFFAAPLDDKESYYTRKICYAMHLKLVVGLNKRILILDTGNPVSVHDARVLANNALAINSDLFFSYGQYIYGDSAYREYELILTPFKVNSTFGTLSGRNKLNRHMAERRVLIENISSRCTK